MKISRFAGSLTLLAVLLVVPKSSVAQTANSCVGLLYPVPALDGLVQPSGVNDPLLRASMGQLDGIQLAFADTSEVPGTFPFAQQFPTLLFRPFDPALTATGNSAAYVWGLSTIHTVIYLPCARADASGFYFQGGFGIQNGTTEIIIDNIRLLLPSAVPPVFVDPSVPPFVSDSIPPFTLLVYQLVADVTGTHGYRTLDVPLYNVFWGHPGLEMSPQILAALVDLGILPSNQASTYLGQDGPTNGNYVFGFISFGLSSQKTYL